MKHIKTAKIKRQAVTSGENRKKLKSYYISSGNVKWHKDFRKQFISFRILNLVIIWPVNNTAKQIHKRPIN